MGYEVVYTCHPRKEEGSGYDTEKKEEKTVKVGKPFEEIPLENLAASIMSQLARRDVWVIDVKIVELARREIAFKECKDGQGIMLKNRRFSFNEAAQMVAEDIIEAPPVCEGVQLQPHELINRKPQVQETAVEDLYAANPDKPVPVKRTNTNLVAPPVNQKRVLYKVIFDPLQWTNEARANKLKFTIDKEYPVHQVVQNTDLKDKFGNPRLDMQKIVVTDDTGRPVKVDEKYFTTVGQGLLADAQLNFSGSGSSQRGLRKPKLAFEDELYIETPPEARSSARGRASIPDGIPVDDGSIPDDILRMPDIRPGRS